MANHAQQGFIFDLGSIDVSGTIESTPLFDAVVAPTYIEGDVLLQFEWNRLGNVSTDISGDQLSSGVGKNTGKQGDWANLFLFKTDNSDISGLAAGEDDPSEDIQFYTVKANWCGHSVTRHNYERYDVPDSHRIAKVVDPAKDSRDSGANGKLDDDSDDTNNKLEFGGASSNVNNYGNFNMPVESKVFNYDQTNPAVNDQNTHMNLAGEYMRYFSAKLFGDRLGYGLDIFSNERELIDDVKGKDVSLNEDIMTHLSKSNEDGIPDGTGKTRTNIPWLILTQLLHDPSGRERVETTLSTDIQTASKYASSVNTALTDTVAYKSSEQASNPAGQPSDIDTSYHRIPLKAGDKLRIKVTLKNDNNHSFSDSFSQTVPERTYIIEYLLTEQASP